MSGDPTPIAKATPIFEQGHIVRLPFPFTDRPVQQKRPALVVSRGGVGAQQRLIWVAMITSAANRPWPQDVSLGDDFQAMGLPIASVVRPAKIAALNGAFAESIGRAPEAVLARVLAEIASIIGADGSKRAR